jgi:hypothetical protein
MTEEIKFKLSSEDSSILSKVFGPVNANINQIQDSLDEAKMKIAT